MTDRHDSLLAASALPEGHPDRAALEAATPGDQRALQAGRALGALLSTAAPERTVGASPDVLAAIRGQVTRDLRAGRPWRLVLLVLSALVTSGLASLAIGDLSRFAVFEGSVCFSIELLAAAAPLLGMALVGRGLAAQGPRRAAFAAAGGALAGQLALVALCPEHDSAHLLVFHTGGVLAAALLGLASSWLPLKLAAR